MVTLLGGCGASSPVQRSLVPLIEPPDIDLDGVTLAANEDKVENLLSEGTGAIDFSGLINYYRKQAGTSLLSWDERLYRVAASRALELSTNTACWQNGQTQDAAHCPRVGRLIERAQREGYAFKNLLENVFISVGESMDMERPVRAWLASSPHKNNLEHRRIKNIGVAIARSGEAIVYVAVLGNE